ncbi:hypothetical protein TNCT_341751, partial [Trichonephila clavata]
MTQLNGSPENQLKVGFEQLSKFLIRRVSEEKT